MAAFMEYRSARSRCSITKARPTPPVQIGERNFYGTAYARCVGTLPRRNLGYVPCQQVAETPETQRSSAEHRKKGLLKESSLLAVR